MYVYGMNFKTISPKYISEQITASVVRRGQDIYKVILPVIRKVIMRTIIIEVSRFKHIQKTTSQQFYEITELKKEKVNRLQLNSLGFA